MELDDYVLHCMSTEPTEIFLRMHGEEVDNYIPINLIGSAATPREGGSVPLARDALESLASSAQGLNCAYVTNVKPLCAIGPAYASGFLGLFGGSQSSAYLALSGTGLVRKEK